MGTYLVSYIQDRYPISKPDPEETAMPLLESLLNDDFRGKLMKMQAKLGEMEQTDCPLTHHFAPGMYGREIFLPAGSLIIGKIHKHAHLNFVMSGDVSVVTFEGIRRIKAPCVFTSTPGTKRFLYTHTDTVWVTVHLNEDDGQDLEKIEDYVIAKSFEEYDAFVSENKVQDVLVEVTP